MSMLGWIVPNLPFFTLLQDKLALGLMMGNEFRYGSQQTLLLPLNLSFSWYHLLSRTFPPPEGQKVPQMPGGQLVFQHQPFLLGWRFTLGPL